MTSLPASLGGSGALVAWTIQAAQFASTWSSGEGAYLFGGRWNRPGQRVLYTAIDPATAIIEVAVHKGFKVMSTVPHHLHHFSISQPSIVHVVQPEEVPNPLWLAPLTPCEDQMAWGDALLAAHPFVLIPSAVSPHSWNLLVNVLTAKPHIRDPGFERFALDTRLRKC